LFDINIQIKSVGETRRFFVILQIENRMGVLHTPIQKITNISHPLFVTDVDRKYNEQNKK